MNTFFAFAMFKFRFRCRQFSIYGPESVKLHVQSFVLRCPMRVSLAFALALLCSPVVAVASDVTDQIVKFPEQVPVTSEAYVPDGSLLSRMSCWHGEGESLHLHLFDGRGNPYLSESGQILKDFAEDQSAVVCQSEPVPDGERRGFVVTYTFGDGVPYRQWLLQPASADLLAGHGSLVESGEFLAPDTP